ncbi:MAG: hypothetical protein ACYC5A_01770 [Thermoleophilia bacterium]
MGIVMLTVALAMSLGTSIGTGATKVGQNAYEVGSADAAPTKAKIGDTIHLQGSGILQDHELLVLFGVRVGNIVYAVDVGTTSSDASGNWSVNVQVPASVEVITTSASTAAAGSGAPGGVAATAVDEADTPKAIGEGAASGIEDDSRIFRSGEALDYQPVGVAAGDWVAVTNGSWHFAAITLGEDGAVYGTNTNFIEVNDGTVDDAGNNPGSSPSTTSYGSVSRDILPETGWPASVAALCGMLCLATGHLINRREN